MRVLVGVASVLAAAQPARAQQHAAVDEPANRAPPCHIPCSFASHAHCPRHAGCLNNPLDWTEQVEGYTCEEWGNLGFCVYGDDYYNADGISANRACCSCDGGRLLANCRIPADMNVPSGHGTPGECTPDGWLQHGSSCRLSCDRGYALTGSVPECYDGELLFLSDRKSILSDALCHTNSCLFQVCLRRTGNKWTARLPFTRR